MGEAEAGRPECESAVAIREFRRVSRGPHSDDALHATEDDDVCSFDFNEVIPMKFAPFLLLCLLLCNCASETINYPPSVVQNSNGTSSVRAIPAIKNSGIDRVGRRDVTITRNSLEIREYDPSSNAPVKRELVMNRAGQVVGINETPLVAGANASHTTNTINNVWSGVVKQLIGAGFSALTAIGLANAAAGQVSTAANVSNVAERQTTARAAINARAATEQLRILHP